MTKEKNEIQMSTRSNYAHYYGTQIKGATNSMCKKGNVINHVAEK